MKLFKRLMAVMFALTLTLGMGTRVYAEDTDGTESNGTTTYTITITKDLTDKAEHTYGAYQIFKGDLAEKDGKKVLSNINWGDSIDESKVAQLITDLNNIEGLTVAAGSDAAAVAKAIGDAKFANDSAEAQAIADAFSKALGAAKATQSTPRDDGKYVLSVPAGY